MARCNLPRHEARKLARDDTEARYAIAIGRDEREMREIGELVQKA